jgi:pimeloyl-ACP methyl ester carboxylesterase
MRIVNWISYQEGILYLKNASSSFAGLETRGQVDLVSRMQVQSSPGVVARGTLAMFHWDGTTVLPQINVPVLILVGKQDTTTLPSASATMERSIPHAQMQVIDRSSHYALLEKNEVVNDAISQFAAVVLR